MAAAPPPPNLGRTRSNATTRVDDLTALPPGVSVGKYRIAGVLGQGGFGITYLARDTQLDREVAIKEYLPVHAAVRQPNRMILPRSTQLGDTFLWGRDRFLAEARTLARLEKAPGIVNVYDFLEANGTVYMVMALVPGETLDVRLKREPRPSATFVEGILFPLLDGLELVYAAGFLHRDIKPGNILIDDAGHPTLIDFGASRIALEARTQPMTAVYTPRYAALEQMSSADQGPPADIYALAATIYHCVAGTAPPDARDRIIDEKLVPAVEAGKGRHAPRLLTGLDAALGLRPGERPASIAEWRRILNGGKPRQSARQTTAGGRDTASRKPWLVGGVVAAAAVLAAGSWWATRPSLAPAEPVARLDDKAPSPPPAQAEPRSVADAEARRLADETTRAEAVARDKAIAEATARRAAEERARAETVAREKALAEAEAKRLSEERARAEADARDRAQADAEARRRAEAEARRLADEKARTEAAARDKALAEAEARRVAEEKTRAEVAERERAKALADAKAADVAKAEAAEAAAKISPLDRRRLQVALTSLGFDTGGADGAFGPRTRQMIAGWQRSQGLPESGFLPDAQGATLLKAAEVAVARWEEDQKRLEQERRVVAERQARERPVAPAATAAPPAAPVEAPSGRSFSDMFKNPN